jgi:hypothetical protein
MQGWETMVAEHLVMILRTVVPRPAKSRLFEGLEKRSDPIYLLKTAGEMAEWLKAAVC